MSTPRILRTRSGRELRRIEYPSRKAKQSVASTDTSTDKNEKTILTEDSTEFSANSKADPIIKRKRGRPKNSERELNLQNLKTLEIETNSRDAQLQNEVDQVDQVDTNIKRKKPNDIEQSDKEMEPPRRKPRMASLNALAKVNAVLECYRFETKKDIQEQIKKIDKKCSEEQEKLLLENPNKEETDENVFQENIEVLNKQTYIPTVQLPNKSKIVCEKITETKLPEKIRIPMIDKFVQTDVFHKSCQTDRGQFPYDKQPKLCTCHKSCDDIFPYYSPPPAYAYLTNSIHIKSSSLAHANAHTLAVPVVKKHVLWEKDNDTLTTPKLTNNASCLVDTCLTNTLMKNSFPCSKLMYLASYREKVSQDPKVEWKGVDKVSDNNTKNRKELLVPCLNYTKISIPNSQYRNHDPKMNNIQKIIKKTKGKNTNSYRKKCTGWEFDGEAVEETIKVGNETITRKYYQGLKRNEEDFKIHDAVLLKSGLDRAESDYVARISALWEDNEGMYAGDMMMSVFWYYKLEQTSGKVNDINGEKMEVFASRHKDDNSVACIIDRCFVVSFPQFCRFRAQQLIFQENRKKTSSLVPESKNNRSRFIPSPDTDPHIVYFCRYGYDYRCGKILKNN